jgi:hypothetical protein
VKVLGKCSSCGTFEEGYGKPGGGGKKTMASVMKSAGGQRRESFGMAAMVSMATHGDTLVRKARANRAATIVRAAAKAAAAAMAAAQAVSAPAVNAVATAVSITERSSLQLGRTIGRLALSEGGMRLHSVNLSDTKLRAHDLIGIAKGAVGVVSHNNKPLLIRSLDLSENPLFGFYQTSRVRRRRIHTSHGAIALRALLTCMPYLTDLNLNDCFLGGFTRASVNAAVNARAVDVGGHFADSDKDDFANTFSFVALAATAAASPYGCTDPLFARLLSVVEPMRTAGCFGLDCNELYAAILEPCIAPPSNGAPLSSDAPATALTPASDAAADGVGESSLGESSLGVGLGFTARLTKLDVSNNGMDSVSMAALIGLIDRCRLLQELNLSQNPMGTAVFDGSDTGVSNVHQELGEGATSKSTSKSTGVFALLVQKLQQQHQRLRLLDLSCCSLCRTDISEFSSNLGGCNVRSLDLSENHFSDERLPLSQQAAVCVIEALRNDIGIEVLILVRGRPIPVLAVRRLNTEINRVAREKARKARAKVEGQLQRKLAHDQAVEEVRMERAKRAEESVGKESGGKESGGKAAHEMEADMEEEVQARAKEKLELIQAKAAAGRSRARWAKELDAAAAARVKVEGGAAATVVAHLMEPPIAVGRQGYGDATEAAVLEFLDNPPASAMHASECLRSLMMLWAVEAMEWEAAWAADEEVAIEVMMDLAWKLFTPDKESWEARRTQERNLRQSGGGDGGGGGFKLSLLESQYLLYWWEVVYRLPLFEGAGGRAGERGLVGDGEGAEEEASRKEAEDEASGKAPAVTTSHCHTGYFALMRQVQGVASANRDTVCGWIKERVEAMVAEDGEEEDNISHAEGPGGGALRTRLVGLRPFCRVSRQDHESVRCICPTVDFESGTMAVAPDGAGPSYGGLEFVSGKSKFLGAPMPMGQAAAARSVGRPVVAMSEPEQFAYKARVDEEVYLPLVCAKAALIDRPFQQLVQLLMAKAVHAHQRAVANGSYAETTDAYGQRRSRVAEVTSAALGSCSEIEIKVLPLPPLGVDAARDALAQMQQHQKSGGSSDQSASIWPKAASLTALNRCTVACGPAAAAIKCALRAFGAWPQVLEDEGTGAACQATSPCAPSLVVVSMQNSFYGLKDKVEMDPEGDNGTSIARSRGRKKRESKQAKVLLSKHGLGHDLRGDDEVDRTDAEATSASAVVGAADAVLAEVVLNVIMRSGEQRMVCEIRVVDEELLAMEAANMELQRVQAALQPLS